MPFVKLDCGILDSTLWVDREAREVFVTALLMAEPWEIKEPTPQINVRDLSCTGFSVPVGWYGFLHAAGSGIVRRSGLSSKEGLDALERLGAPDAESRSHDFDGRRLVRVDGGFVVLNYDKYRKRDYTNADRQARHRARNAVTLTGNAVTSRRVTQAEAEAEEEGEVERVSKRSTSSHPSPRSGEVEEVVTYYVSKRPTRKPGSAERAKIKARLKEFTVAELKEAIDGCLKSPWTNEQGKTFDSLELIVRNSAKVNQYRAQKMDAGEAWVARKSAEMLAQEEKANGTVRPV